MIRKNKTAIEGILGMGRVVTISLQRRKGKRQVAALHCVNNCCCCSCWNS